jgi:hypothetical protein
MTRADNDTQYKCSQLNVIQHQQNCFFFILSVVMLNVAVLHCHAECHYALSRHAECSVLNVFMMSVAWLNAVLLSVTLLRAIALSGAECHYSGCRYARC